MTNGKNVVALVSLAAIASAVGAYVAANGGSNAFHAKAVFEDEAIVFAFDGKSMKFQHTNKIGGMVVEHGDSYSDKQFINNEGDYKITECNQGKGLGSNTGVQELGNGYRVSFNGVAADITIDGGVPTKVDFAGKVYTVTSFGWGAGASFTLDGDCASTSATAERELVSPSWSGFLRGRYYCPTMWWSNAIMGIYYNSDPNKMARRTITGSCRRLGDTGSKQQKGSFWKDMDFIWGCYHGRYFGRRAPVFLSGSNDFVDWIFNIAGAASPLGINVSGVGRINPGFYRDYKDWRSTIASWRSRLGRSGRYLQFSGHSLGGALAFYHGRYYYRYSAHSNTLGVPNQIYWGSAPYQWARSFVNFKRSLIGWKTGDFVHFPEVASFLLGAVMMLFGWLSFVFNARYFVMGILKMAVWRKARSWYRYLSEYRSIWWHGHKWWGHFHNDTKYKIHSSCSGCNSLLFTTAIGLHSKYLRSTNHVGRCICYSRNRWYMRYAFGY